MNKFEQERKILELAKPLLKEIYGEFNLNDKQIDCPDASIILQKMSHEIGIEITSIDREDIKQYFNDKKNSKEVEIKQLEELNNNVYSKNPIKKLSIPFTHKYIYDGVIKKEKKYIEYYNSNNYKEIIILIYSTYLTLNYKFFEDYIKPWTQYLLNKESFPFDKVIFVCESTEKNIIVYKKNQPSIQPPSINHNKELGITAISGPILPVGETINLNKIFRNPPLVPKKSKNVSKIERREKRKTQKNSRKTNRTKY
ncbi:hypothetical protein [Aliarcobacter butzleri]|uniref:hypothetical protein n=1 Tax=Aliarcobacter butzleri TaxID=28197 RepID=UPI00022958AB|nr:hypothetical protein [Aliarcobacter butzleri]MCT7611413.1 hypothetical protein [Aliarcobacter butzleri]MDN5094303.1 hypothetical protein [Aliarcobacter butzleri]BAK71805.1 hypothetical protein ABED_2088 [Aliarcobacter butzleri ED-1]